MRILFVIAIGLGLLGAAGLLIVNSTSGQDALMKKMLQIAFDRQPQEWGRDSLRVVICGSASPLGNNPDSAQACIAIVTPEHFFLIDAGAGSQLRINQAGLPSSRLTGVLLTHFHSDHIAALPDINLASWVTGNKGGVTVYGPAGIQQVIDGFNQAYALDRGYRVAHHGAELMPIQGGQLSAVKIQPGIIWQDGSLTIRAIEVDHSPIEPALGYRIDYKGRSVAVSGDTVVHEGFISAVRDVDVVIHDVLARHVLDGLKQAAAEAGRTRLAQITNDVIDYHADSLTLQKASDDAGIQNLVLYHLVPVPANAFIEKIFMRGLSSKTILGKDLMVFDLPVNTAEVNITDPP